MDFLSFDIKLQHKARKKGSEDEDDGANGSSLELKPLKHIYVNLLLPNFILSQLSASESRNPLRIHITIKPIEQEVNREEDMDSPPTTPSKSSRGAWTEAAKLDLLLRIIDSSKEAIKWKDVDLPSGRTEKSCIHMMERLRKEAATLVAKDPSAISNGEIATKVKAKKSSTTAKDADELDDPEPTSPVKRVKKRKNDEVDNGNEDDDDDVVFKKPFKPKAGKKSKMKKNDKDDVNIHSDNEGKENADLA